MGERNETQNQHYKLLQGAEIDSYFFRNSYFYSFSVPICGVHYMTRFTMVVKETKN